MTRETEPGAAAPSTLESPTSPKRRNRKKGRRAGEEHEDDEAHDVADVATADLISLPSPVAAVTPTVDVFATLETTMGDLALETHKEDGLLKLPVFPSSGRIPRTPPPTPEHSFIVHSPEKEQSRVAPMSPEVQQQLTLPTVVETHLLPDVEVVETEKLPTGETEGGETTPVDAGEIDTAGENELLANKVVEQETSQLSSTMAAMNLSNGGMSVEPEKPSVGKPDAVERTGGEHIAPVADGHVGVDHVGIPSSQDNVEVNSISTRSTEDTTIENTSETDPSAVLDPTVAAPKSTMVHPVSIETPLVAEPLIAETPKVPEPAEVPGTLKPVQAQSPPKPTEEAYLAPQKQGSAASQESQQPLRRNKRKGGSPEQVEYTTHTTPAATTSRKAHESKVAVPPPPNVESAGSLKHVIPKDSPSGSHPQPRSAKRKGDESDATPPSAPTNAAAKEIRPKRLIARPTPSLIRGNTGAEPKPKLAAVARPVQEPKKDSMMNPTASSVARATAAEARKAALKTAAAKKVPARKPMRSKPLTKSAALPKAPSGQDKSSLAPPAPVVADDGDDSQRNVKRRLNVTDVEAASNRLYEDAKEAKARKDARRAELQETYSFAPQVNNFKRRTVPGETEDPTQDRFSRLHAQAKELQEKKRGLQQQHEREGCTFAPTISARAKRLAQPSTGPRYENLYKHAQEMKQKREEKLLEKAKTTEEQCPFKPKIATSKYASSKPPVEHKPLYDSARDKQKRLALEQKKIESEMSKCTFKPKVSAKRIKSKTEDPSDATTNAATDANPYNRLYQASIDRTERLQKLRQERDEEEKAQAPFQPKITARSRVMKAKAKTKEPFHKRLYNKDYMKKLDAEREQRRLDEEQQFTFKPEINEPPEQIKAKVNERASPGKNIFERLYDEKDKMKEKIELGQELRLQKEMAECTFRPQIEVDAAQSNGEAAPPVWERLLSYDKAHVIEEREKLKEQLEMQECTFKPEVKSPDTLLMKQTPSGNVFERLTGNGSTSMLDPSRASFTTTRPSSSPERQSPDMKGGSVGRIIKSTKFSRSAESRKLSRTNSISQPSSVKKPTVKRSTSFSGPNSPALSPTMSDVLSGITGGLQQTQATSIPNGDATIPQSVTKNYESWSAELDAKLRQL